jgi:long-chain acyl-CoA synthetase
LVYTSGTTGQPKAVPLTHANIFAEADGIQLAMRLSESEVILGLLPLFHVYSQVVTLWLVPMIGASVVFIPELSSNEIARAFQEGGITALVGVPRLWYLFHKKIFEQVNGQPKYLQFLFKGLLKANGWLRDLCGVNAGRWFFPSIHKFFGNKLRLAVSAGARFDPDIARDFHRMGFTLLQGYGLTETAGAMTFTRFEDNKVGSVGKPLEGVEVKIDSPDSNGIGEVLARGPIIMAGYYKNPEANKEAYTADGFFRTGDLGKFDRAGNLYILGRSKEVFKLPSGKNVFPDDIEAHYSHSPLISEICVLGVKDEASPFKGAEKLSSVVVPDFNYLKAHHIANAREAIRFELDNLGRDLPEYQRVHDYILRTKTLPRTTTNKVRRFELRKQLETDSNNAQPERKSILWEFAPADIAMMESPAGKAITNALHLQAPETKSIHPQMNLEIDLGLDSLARTECIATVEKLLNIQFSSEEAVASLTVGDLINLADSKLCLLKQDDKLLVSTERTLPQSWHELLTSKPKDIPEMEELLKNRPIIAMIVYIALKLLLLVEKALFRIEVSGWENLSKLQGPYLICPNHQSKLDALFICSTYPFRLLAHTFHVGASEYFTGPISRRLARLINIVPIDPDARLLGAMQVSATGLNAGKILNVYPEGQRSFDGELGEFKKGPAILAVELDLPIIPVAIDGSYRVLPRKAKWIHFAKVKIRFGEPINARLIAAEGANEEERYEVVTEALKAKIQAMLNELRS